MYRWYKLEIWSNSGSYVKKGILLKDYLLLVAEFMGFDHLDERFDLFETIMSEALFDEVVGVARVLRPVGPHRRFPIDAHMENNAKITI